METIQLGPLAVNFISKAAWQSWCQRTLKQGGYHHVVTLNPEMVLLAENNNAFCQAVSAAELRVPDGAGLIWARWYLRSPYWLLMPSLLAFLKQPVERITGVDAVHDLFRFCQRARRPLYVLGGKHSHVREALDILHHIYPQVMTEIAPAHEYNEINNGPLPVLQDIAARRPAVVMVAYGAPQQILWLERHKQDLAQSGVNIGIGVGGAFDILSERLPRAPERLRAMNLEWLWRLYLEPRRFIRIYNAVFVFPRLMRKYKKLTRFSQT